MNWRRDLIEFRKSLLAADILCLDDIGAENISDFLREELWLLIDDRIRQQRPLIISCNFDSEDLETWVGARIRSRIEGACELVRVSGADMRQAMKEDRIRRSTGK